MPAKGVQYHIGFHPDVQQKLFIVMKKFWLSHALACLWVCTNAQTPAKTSPIKDTALLSPLELRAVRAAEHAPFAKSNLSQKDIEAVNLGQDLPFILQQTPSVVVNSDAGNGVGYTGIRIRGTDASRINLTLNGIPYNDAESQGTFFVNLPDFASSANSIQIQRGVGTSTNGAGAFGANINVATNDIQTQSYGEANNSIGSYNTLKNTFKFGTGLLGKHFTIDARVSQISSDGYIERASTDLKSFYFSTAYVDVKNTLRLNIFHGSEKTYQAWNGVPESKLNTQRTYNAAGQDQPGKPYEDETDNYDQTHYQLFYNHSFSAKWKGNMAVFLTRGKGYFEEYRAGQELSEYGLPNFVNGNDTTQQTNLVRQKWLDNYFYGTIFSLQYHDTSSDVIIGGGWNRYDGNHFGKIVYTQAPIPISDDFEWYRLDATKRDFSLFTKWTQSFKPRLQGYFDVQLRSVNYQINGFRANPGLRINNQYTFINPKVGISYWTKRWELYASYALSGKEPNRDDFETQKGKQPTFEMLHDFEGGATYKGKNYTFGANLYYMLYRNQLVLAGNVNDVGAYTRINVPSSYRLGVELQGNWVMAKFANLSVNLTLSQNKIKNFTEKIDDYDNGGTKNNFYSSTDISFSPDITGGATLNVIPVKNGQIAFINRYVGRQFLDNTSQVSRSLNPYFVQDVRLSYTINKRLFKSTTFIAQLNNVFNKLYEANGYTFSYISGGQVTENFYYPMAPFNFLFGINIKV